MTRNGVTFLIATSIDLVLWLSAASDWIGVALATGLHVGLVVAMAALAAATETNTTDAFLPWPFRYTCLLVLGPLGGLGCIALATTASHERTVSPSLAAWYERLAPPRGVDAASELHERLSCDRAPRLGVESPRRFAHIMREGSLSEKQSVLGLIGLKYTPEYLHVLKLALASPTPSVRVQAAAVHTKLREHYKRQYKAALARLAAPTAELVTRAGAARALLTAIESGFLEPGEKRTALSVCRDVHDCLSVSSGSPSAIEIAVFEALGRLLEAHEPVRAEASGPVALAGHGSANSGAAPMASAAALRGRTGTVEETGTRPGAAPRGSRHEERSTAATGLAISLPESA